MKDRIFPDFLCIGAQKAGTSWLHKQLRHHPDLWMPPLKELHYFDQHKRQGQTDLRRGLRWRFSYFEKTRWKRLPIRTLNHLRRMDFAGLRWDATYFFGLRNDNWYASLFAPGRGKVVGEITPDYSAIDRETVGAVHALMPDLKIIFLMRDPIERAWSHTRMKLGRFQGRAIQSIEKDELIAFFERTGVQRRSDYVRTLDNWGAYYPQEQFFIRCTEDIKQRPEQLLLDLFQFLGVDASEQYISSTAHRKVHAGRPVEIPEDLERYLAALYADQLRVLEDRFGGCTSIWRERAEALLAS